MSKFKIRIIISLMALSSLALIAFQVYWIGYINRSNNEVFGANVREAMQEVIRKLEKQELIYITQKKTLEDQKRKELLAISRSKPVRKTPKIKNRILEEDKAIASHSIDDLQHSAQSDVLNFGPIHFFGKSLPLNEISIQFDVQNPNLDDIESIYEFNEFVGKQMEAYQKAFVDSVSFNKYEMTKPLKKAKNRTKNWPSNKQKIVAENQNISSEQMTKLSQKSEIMKDVFGDYLLKERPISERINKIGLDSMLHSEILQRGYNIPMEYGIALSNDTSQLHYLSSPKLNLEAQKIIKSEGYQANLFPNDMFNGNNKLLVYFPDRKTFLLRSIWMNILGSIAMIGIVLVCFYIAVNTILKQKKLAEIKNDFINNMTHEFKTPISTISLACEVLNDKDMGNNPQVVSRYLGIISDENKRLGTQVEKVLQTALLDKGDVKMKLGSLDIHELIENVVENISPQIELKNGNIELDLKAELPIIEADSVHITNIVFNLLDNAIKYSKNNPQIKVESDNVETGILISIIDNGIGISQEAQRSIFEKFYRVPTGNLHDVKGFGLGLSYVKKMVEEHHGTIKVNSSLGEGSTFELFLPQKQRLIA
ncbi:MAG: HAMP domain-containing sensor histidine kinase [Bacteroidota bacterium]